MPEARKKSTLKALWGALIAAALVVAPMVTVGASAAPKDESTVDAVAEWPADTVGVKGTLVAGSSKANDVGYWQALYAAHEAKCYKVDGPFDSDHGTVSDDKLTVTLKPFQAGWPGDHWEVLIIKSGSQWNSVIDHPQAGVAYASPPNNAGNQGAVSHWIVCKGKTPQVEPTQVTPTLTVTLPTCDLAGSIAFGENVEWKSEINENGTTTWYALPKAGTVFPKDAVNTWTVPTDLSKLTENCGPEQPTKPQPKVSVRETPAVDCAVNDATVTTVTTTIDYTWDESSQAWVELPPVDSAPVVTHRALTDAELSECPLVPGDIESVCVGDVPYLGYEVSLPEGFVADSENPVTITFVNPDGDDYVVTGQPLSGSLLWPGASAGEPKMWPGWELVNGEYAQTDGNYAWTREGITVRFEVNPTYSTEVEYPEASAECANPPIGGPEATPTAVPASTDGLAVTGGGVSPIVVAAGGAALAAGIAVVAIAAYRRRRAGTE